MQQYRPLILLGAVTVGLAVMPFVGIPEAWILYLFTFYLYLAAANMWNLLAGFSGLLALCPAAFIGLGGYTVTILTWLELPFYWGIVAGGFAAALFAGLISVSVFRMKGVYFAIGTLVVPAILRLVFLRWRPVGGDFQGGGAGYIVKGSSEVPSEVTYWLGLSIGLASVIIIGVILRSKFGFGLAAVRDNDISASSLGVDVFRLKLSSFLIAAFVMGITGAIFYIYQGYIEPNSAFDISWLMIVMLATVMGGIGLVWGPVVGTIIVVILQFQLARYPGYSLLIQGLILIAIMLVAPQGLLGLVRDWRKKGGIRPLRRTASTG
jgi:branched-chain amino acid transport system permease protein